MIQSASPSFSDSRRKREAPLQLSSDFGAERSTRSPAPSSLGAFSFLTAFSIVGNAGSAGPKRAAFSFEWNKNTVEERVAAPAVRAFLNTAERWRLSREQMAVVLGYIGNRTGAERLLRGHFRAPTRDVEDRIKYVVTTSLLLGRVFGEDASAERAWLEAERPEFGNRSALGLLLGGHMEDLLRVVSLAKAEWGP